MSTAVNLNDLLALPEQERAELALALVNSLDAPGHPVGNEDEWERKWVVEAERRLDAFERGEAQAVNAKEAFDAVRAELKRVR